MTRLLLTACLALLPLTTSPQRAKPPGQCPARPADCQINAQVFDFGRGQMTSTSPSINGTNTISVTCTRANQDNLSVQVIYNLQAIPAEPAHQMRDSNLQYLRYSMYVDAARTRYWGDGISYGTFTFQGALFLDDRNRVGTLAHVIYGRVEGGQPALPGQWLGLLVAKLDYQPFCQ